MLHSKFKFQGYGLIRGDGGGITGPRVVRRSSQYGSVSLPATWPAVQPGSGLKTMSTRAVSAPDKWALALPHLDPKSESQLPKPRTLQITRSLD